MKKSWFLSVVIAFSSIVSAQIASPAHKLLDEAFQVINAEYNGTAKLDLAELKTKLTAELDKICADKGESCPVESAYPVLKNMMISIRQAGDEHFAWTTKENRITDGEAPEDQFLDLGIAVSLNRGANNILIRRVYPGSPADRAGLKRTNSIIGIEGKLFAGLSLREVTNLYYSFWDKENVNLIITTDGKDQKEVSIKQEISSHMLPYLEFFDCMAVIQVDNYTIVKQVANRFHQLLKEAIDKNACGLVIDLRGNPGGWTQASLGILAAFTKDDPGFLFDLKSGTASLFYKDGNVILEPSPQTKPIDVPKITPVVTERVYWNKPFVVLVNARSASASETTAHYLQKYSKTNVCVIGEPTYGVLNTLIPTFKLSDGSFLYISALKKDMNGVYEPSKVTPDIEIKENFSELLKGNDILMNKGLEIAKSGRCSLK